MILFEHDSTTFPNEKYIFYDDGTIERRKKEKKVEDQNVTIPLTQYSDWLIMITKIDSIKKILTNAISDSDSFSELATIVRSCEKVLDIEEEDDD